MLDNLRGLAVLAASVGGMLALGHKFPALADDRHFPLYVTVAFTALAIAASAQGIKSKILFVPTWWAGLCSICWACGELGGGWWAAAIVGGLLTLFAGFLAIGAAEERKQWAEAPDKLLEAKAAALSEDWPAFWKAVAASFFSKGSLAFPPDVCRHDLQVLELVASQVPPAEVPACLPLVQERLEMGAREEKDGTTVDSKPLNELLAWLKAKAPAGD